ncbi:MAG TPA: protein phosphatase 2C domain-containing protein [Oculatellaceae cyanobacterium]
MHVTCKTFWLQKHGNAVDDYEDAAYPANTVDEQCDSFRCAIADGATEASFSGLWSNILVEGLVYGTEISQLRREFTSKVGMKALPWYAEEKLQDGAFSAVAVLTISCDDIERRTWQTSAIGDCCVMQVRENLLVKSFPVERPEDFNNAPLLLGSVTTKSESMQEHSGNWLPGDRFLLMTDALACWTLKRLRDQNDAFGLLEGLSDFDLFKDFVAEQRATLDEEGRSLLKNDDVTLMRLAVD